MTPCWALKQYFYFCLPSTRIQSPILRTITMRNFSGCRRRRIYAPTRPDHRPKIPFPGPHLHRVADCLPSQRGLRYRHAQVLRHCRVLAQPARCAHVNTQLPSHADLAYLKSGKGAEEVFYQVFHARVSPYRISIPTALVQRVQDQRPRHSLDLVQLCDRVTVVEHGEGYGEPARYSEEIAKQSRR